MPDPLQQERMAEIEREISQLHMESAGSKAKLDELRGELQKLRGEDGPSISWQRVQLGPSPQASPFSRLHSTSRSGLY